MFPAHRVSWWLANGPIPDGLHVLHRCDVTLCVNPEHLFVGTHLDNMRDMHKKGRRKPLRYEKNGNSVLTRDSVLMIRRLLYSGSTHKEISSEFGISKSTVGQISSRITWVGIEP